MSSGSSLGSLGSLSASSRGSLNSLSTLDIYNQVGLQGSGITGSEVNLQELHQRVEKLLQGHSMSPISEATAASTPLPQPDITNAATNNYLQSVMAGSVDKGLQQSSPYPSSLSSPPVSPYEIGPPPSYEQHMNAIERQRITWSTNAAVNSTAGALSTAVKWSRSGLGFSVNLNSDSARGLDASPQTLFSGEGSNLDVIPEGLRTDDIYFRDRASSPLPPTLRSSSALPLTALIAHHYQLPAATTPYEHSSQFGLTHFSASGTIETLTSADNNTTNSVDRDREKDTVTANQRRIVSTGLETSDAVSNPPLSPISESSSGVGNNLSGGNTRSVSAAVSDESVAGDSGVFEATVKR